MHIKENARARLDRLSDLLDRRLAALEQRLGGLEQDHGEIIALLIAIKAGLERAVAEEFPEGEGPDGDGDPPSERYLH